jgi:hypothetical protein
MDIKEGSEQSFCIFGGYDALKDFSWFDIISDDAWELPISSFLI